MSTNPPTLTGRNEAMATLQELIDDLAHYAAEYAGEDGTVEDKRQYDALSILVESAVDAQEAELAALHSQLSEKDAEIARLRKDAERLEWMQKREAWISRDSDGVRVCWYEDDEPDHVCTDDFDDWRAAIDAAQGEKHAD